MKLRLLTPASLTRGRHQQLRSTRRVSDRQNDDVHELEANRDRDDPAVEYDVRKRAGHKNGIKQVFLLEQAVELGMREN